MTGVYLIYLGGRAIWWGLTWDIQSCWISTWHEDVITHRRMQLDIQLCHAWWLNYTVFFSHQRTYCWVN